ncbi:MAG: hypothetical protein LBC71_07560 [Oscillospiraceae bacterium]|jgi:hypothetical protein|nr:hypothetical protein [Oscillospiraceae bacterium]
MNKTNKEYRYHYEKLNQSQKNVYEIIEKTIRSFKNEVKLTGIHVNVLNIIFESLLLDNADIFYVDSYRFTKDLYKQNIVFRPNYKYSTAETKQYKALLEISLSTFINPTKNKNIYEKVQFVHDQILDSVVYDNTFMDISHTALSVAVKKTAVCEGIAKYVKLAFDGLAINSAVITGLATDPSIGQSKSEAHAWNIVEVNNNWYHLDVTFDLTLKHNRNRYDYFLIGNDEIIKDHSTNTKLPIISPEPMDYYSSKGLAVAKSNELAQLINNKIRNGERIIQFKLLNVRDGLNPVNNVLKVAKQQCQQIFKGSYFINTRYNSALWVFELEIS